MILTQILIYTIYNTL